jgi:hypothetical protein
MLSSLKDYLLWIDVDLFYLADIGVQKLLVA